MTEVVTHQTPPIIHGPSAKEKKYDRQLRLWAANGQQALEDAHILLINSGSGTLGVETLKNLVLPGIGQFTIADSHQVEEADLGVNFFLDSESLGHPRAHSCVKLLEELNPDVKGHAWPHQPLQKLEEVLNANKEPFTLILYSHPVDQTLLDHINEYSRTHKVPVISTHSAGFYGYFHIQLPGNFPIVDTHPDSTATTDLRLLTPWPELSRFAYDLTANIETLDAHEHGHIPYVVLLLHHLEQWKKSHDGNPPSSYAEKTAFRRLVNEAARTNNPEGGEENYDEAAAAVLKTITVSTLSSSVREVFDYEPDSDEANSVFWIITNAVKKFHSEHGVLPLPGSVPDMKAQSQVYVQLQNIYKKKAREDVTEVLNTIHAQKNGGVVTQEEVETYCKNAAFIKLIRGTTPDPQSLQSLADTELNAEFALSPTLMPVYLALLGSEKCPGGAVAEVLDAISAIVTSAAENESVSNAAKEVARAQGGELHNTSSLLGGMVAQEIIKIITKQYVPIDNVCVWDGIVSRSQVFRVP